MADPENSYEPVKAGPAATDVTPAAPRDLARGQPSTKLPGEWRGLEIPRRSTSPDNVSVLSLNEFSELQLVRTSSLTRAGSQIGLDEDAQTPRWRRLVHRAWIRNQGVFLVLISMMFGTVMTATARLLEEERYGSMHPFQILFARMSITSLLCMLYMWWKNTPDWPLGAKGVRLLLVARGTGGFFGVYGMYWSLEYLPLSDATVLTFLAPFIACWACSLLVKEPFTRVEQIGGLISLVGVVLIARPAAIFQHSSQNDQSPSEGGTDGSSGQDATPTGPTPSERLAAVSMSMVGVCGAAIAYTTIRWIGKRAHPLVSVNYFAFWCTLVSTVALIFVPSVPFVLPHTIQQWSLLFIIGTTGFIMQILLTAGLAYEKSSRATNMVYSQELFALLADKVIWGLTPGLLSAIGSSLIVGSAILTTLQKETHSKQNNNSKSSSSESLQDEEMALMSQETGLTDIDERDERPDEDVTVSNSDRVSENSKEAHTSTNERNEI